jgi:proline dehydrogenase
LVARKLLLALAGNTWLRDRALKTAFIRRSVRRFMPGERLEDALDAAARMPPGIATILSKLGENVTSAQDAGEVTRHYLDVIDAVHARGLDVQVSVKPTQLGLDLDPGLSFDNVQRLLEAAGAREQLLWIDMESSPYVGRTLEMYRRARERTPLVGVAVQAYLYRTAADVEALMAMGASLRLVKGAYLEPADRAYPRKKDVDENYFRLACRLLEYASISGRTVHLATHDSVLIDRINAFVREREIGPTAFEHAMLYGIRPRLQEQLAAAGKRVRVLISYGDEWFPWYMRRLAERPANVGFVLRNLFGG